MKPKFFADYGDGFDDEFHDLGWKREHACRWAPAIKLEKDRCKIVVAEDNELFRDTLATILGDAGYEVVDLADGQELSDYLMHSLAAPDEMSPPDLIVTDHGMPKKTGLEAISQLRRADWATPVILITASHDPEVHEEAERLGVRVVRKPFRIEALRAVIDDMIGVDG